MRCICLATGLAVGMVIATAALTTMYPDVPRRMMRDCRRLTRSGKRMLNNMF